jgi:chloramphenicol-sensitive protein RarD
MSFNLPILSAISSYFIWGIMPIFWRELNGTNPFEIVAHRVLWSLLLLSGFMWREMYKGTQTKISKQEILLTFASGIFLAINWSIFVYAIPRGYTLASSLGYFMSPLCMLAAGAIFFSEKLKREQKIALVFLVASLLPLLIGSDLMTFLIATGLALSWMCYSSFRRNSALSSLSSLWLETTIMAPIAIAVLVYQYSVPENLSKFQNHWWLLVFTGPLTLIPLLLYGVAVKTVSFSTLGVLHYMVPFLQLFCAAVLFKESISGSKMLTLVLILIAIGIVIRPHLRKQKS